MAAKPHAPQPVLSPEDPARRPQVSTSNGHRSKADKVTRIITVLGVVVTLIMVPSILNASDNSDDQRRSDSISACRAEANSLVAEATTNFHLARNARDDLQANLNILQADFNILQNEQITAALAQDRRTYNGVVAQLPEKRSAIQTAQDDVRSAQQEVGTMVGRLADATTDYVKAVALSRDDPDGFLRMCRDKPPAEPTSPPTSSTALHGTIGEPETTTTTAATAQRISSRRPTTTSSSTSTTGTTSTTYYSRPDPVETPPLYCVPPLTDLICP